MIRIGNFFFKHRNFLFPLVYALLVFRSRPLVSSYKLAALAGFLIASSGQVLRFATIGLDYIKRGGLNRQVYADRLVTGGLFAHCRNPLYVGNYLLIVGVGVASNSLLFVGLALPFFTFAYAAIITAEENYLRNKFGTEFDEYCARVNRLVPRFTGLGQTLAGMTFNWHRVVTKEYGTTFIWILACSLVVLKNLWQEKLYESSPVLVGVLWGALGLSVPVYFWARWLKKSSARQNKGQKKTAPTPA